MEGRIQHIVPGEGRLNELRKLLDSGGNPNEIALEALELAFASLRQCSSKVERTQVLTEKIEDMQRELFRLGSTDALTGALSRQRFIQEGMLEAEHFKHGSHTFSVLLIGIGGFRALNEKYGLLVGDQILRMVTGAVRTQLRRYDMLGRTGDSELCALLVNANTATAMIVGARIQDKLRQIEIEGVLEAGELPVQLGIAECRSTHKTFFETMKAADEALAGARESGTSTQVCRALDAA
jgi:two-component system cell cycle response regulator